MINIYNSIIFFSTIIIRIGSLFSNKTNKLYLGRKNIKNYFRNNNIDKDKKIWIHVSSVGEFEQVKPLIQQIKTKSNHRIFVTFFSPSVEKSISEYSQIDFSCYLPEDSSKNIKMMYENINPKILIIVKYEFWHHLIKEGVNKNIPIISISSVFRKNQIYFKGVTFFSEILKNINQFYVQNNESKLLLKTIHITKCEVVGDTRFDRVFKVSQEAKKFLRINKFLNNNKTIIIGSSWKSDIHLIKEYINKHNSLKYIIAPHNINENEYAYIEKLFLNKTIRYSLIKEKDISNKNILIIDNIGMLSSIYKYGDIAYIGGAFEGALHNTLEAAVFDLPIIYGEHTNNKKFNEVKDLEKLNLSFSINSSKEFEKKIYKLLNNNKEYGTRNYILNNIGATSKIYKSMNKYLK